jgi:trypsin
VAVVLFGAAERQLKAIEPMQLAPVDSARALLSYGSGVTVVGYGRTDPKRPSSAGIRHEGTMTVTGINGSYVTTSPGTTLTCEGDSGGPELVTIAGKEYVVAVNSLADADCAVYAAGYRVDTAEAPAFVNGPHPSSSS